MIKYKVDTDIFSVKFKCNLESCKGKCCTLEGTLGAPLLESELKVIEETIPRIIDFLPEKNKNVLYRSGFYVRIGQHLYLNNVNDNECVFSYINNGIAKCVFQMFYEQGKIAFKKPISCELFPIRVSEGLITELRYEEREECVSAIEEGIKEDVDLLRFLKSGIIRHFGEDFYNQLLQSQKNKKFGDGNN
ncbi:MAG: DUF3109 family protein [Ignavibacteria bacterium]